MNEITITVSGVQGTGKAFFIKRISDMLRLAGSDVHVVNEDNVANIDHASEARRMLNNPELNKKVFGDSRVVIKQRHTRFKRDPKP